MTEKENLEISAAKIFCHCYQKAVGARAQFQRLNSPPLPDATCKIGDKHIDIEIAHLFGSGLDAQRLLGRKRRVPFSEETLMKQRIIPLNLRLTSELNHILKNKSEKSYQTEKVWLVIRNGFPLWGKEDFEDYSSEILFPEMHPFEKIWLICDPRGCSGLLELCVQPN